MFISSDSCHKDVVRIPEYCTLDLNRILHSVRIIIRKWISYRPIDKLKHHAVYWHIKKKKEEKKKKKKKKRKKEEEEEEEENVQTYKQLSMSVLKSIHKMTINYYPYCRNKTIIHTFHLLWYALDVF